MLEKDQRALEALTKAREDHPDLDELLDLHRDLMSLQLEAKAEIADPVRLLDAETSRQCLKDGVPQMVFDDLAIEPVAFARLAQEMVDALARHRSEWSGLAQQIDAPTATEWRELARDALASGSKPVQGEFSPRDLALLAAELALVPYLESAAEEILPQLELDLWTERICPVCGSPPDFALLKEDTSARRLVCSRCNTEWPYVRLKCPFCRTIDQTKLQYYPSDDGEYRLYVCQDCKRYLKTVDLGRATKRIVPTIERIVTVAMDIAAAEAGYSAG